mgnify:CR=1 FL=1
MAIKLTSNIGGVDIYIDDKKSGEITDKPFVAKLPIGKHRITAKKDLFGAKSINIQLEENDVLAHSFILEKSGNMYEDVSSGKIVQSIGKLVVITSRNDLECEINGARFTPPFSVPEMATGRYELRVNGANIERILNITVKERVDNVYDLDDLL